MNDPTLPLNYETCLLTFCTNIESLNHIFDRSEWGISSLKEWIEGYESTRFTQLNDKQAVVTSEYNMEYVLAWLHKNMMVVVSLPGTDDTSDILPDVEELTTFYPQPL